MSRQEKVTNIISDAMEDVWSTIDDVEDSTRTEINDLKESVKGKLDAMRSEVTDALDGCDENASCEVNENTQKRSDELRFLSDVLKNPNKFGITWVSNNLVSDPHYIVRSKDMQSRWHASQHDVETSEWQGEKSGENWESLSCEDVTLHKIPLNLGTLMRDMVA